MNKKSKMLISQALAAFMLLVPLAGCAPEEVNEGAIVTFNYNDNSSRPYSVLVDENGRVARPDDPERVGYTFDGWYTESTGGTQVTTFPYEASSNVTLYAHWDEREYNVRFHYNYDGAEEPYTTVPVRFGRTVSAPEEEPTRDDGAENSVFYRWETLPIGGSEVEFPYTVRDDADFYARWVKGIVNVTFNYNYKDFEGNPITDDTAPAAQTIRAIEDEDFVLPNRFADTSMRDSRLYYEFRGWALTENATSGLSNSRLRDITYDAEDDVTLYAVWQRARYGVVFRNNYVGMTTSTFFQTTIDGGDAVNAPEGEPTRNGYTFMGWYTSERSLTPVEFPFIPTSPTNIFARWKKDAVETTIFDAEYLEYNPDEQYPGYSGSARGRGVIQSDSSGVFGATTQFPAAGEPQPVGTEGRFVSYLYKEGATLRFVINSSAAVSGVTLVARFAVEVNRNFVIGPTGANALAIRVNGTALNYSPISFAGQPDLNNGAPGSIYQTAFRDYTISTSVSLVQGENVIELVVMNSNAAVMGGTMQAAAPMVDCIKLTTTATLTWSPIYDNLYEWTNM